ncbi:LrgB family protein [Solidesulfovibrio sp.]|uniref:LrgB family protein n=1 Tax=Solidesulfovibrio sp. TaxID=2910990 RepID=UPI0026196C9C|nr:LrgB family protein [Solidesulfovibrio sp.]
MERLLFLAGCVGATMAAYLGVRRLYLRFNHPLLNVVALSAGAVIALLVACDIPYAAYAPAKDLMTAPLGPATVALAVPLYRHRDILRRHGPGLLASVALGAFLAMFSAGLTAKAGGLPREVVVSILPKGVSIPFAVEISRLYDGVPALSAAFVVATGTLGSLLGGWLLTRSGIGHPVARGLALGTVSHAQGTATALMEGERQGAMAGLAMILAGMLTAAFAPLAVRLLGLL